MQLLRKHLPANAKASAQNGRSGPMKRTEQPKKRDKHVTQNVSSGRAFNTWKPVSLARNSFNF
jgi:hypothetical protein